MHFALQKIKIKSSATVDNQPFLFFIFKKIRMEQKLKVLNDCMTDHPDFPKPGIIFKNIMPLFSDPERLALLGEVLEETIRKNFPGCTKLVGLESRGFLMGMYRYSARSLPCYQFLKEWPWLLD
jgi:hypothetical protein